MKVRVRWTETAVAQLEAIADYVALTSPVYAARLIDGLIASVAVAVEFPRIGRIVPEVGRDDTRQFIEPPYRIIYRVDGDTVHVLAVVHSRRDFEQLRDLVRESQSRTYSGAGGPNTGAFDRYIGIDYSGAETPTSSLKGLRVYVAEGMAAPVAVLPPPSPRKYWTRRGIAEWLAAELAKSARTLVGIDHAFSFPLDYFEAHRLPLDWPGFLDDFQSHWPTDSERTYVDFVRHGKVGNGAARIGDRRWRRLTDKRAGAAKSVFHFDVEGQVAKSTHAGLPWLRFLRHTLGNRVHFWPFDGWKIPENHSSIVEVYPRLWNREIEQTEATSDEHDAYSIALALQRADANDTLDMWFNPDLSDQDRAAAEIEGWILGTK